LPLHCGDPQCWRNASEANLTPRARTGAEAERGHAVNDNVAGERRSRGKGRRRFWIVAGLALTAGTGVLFVQQQDPSVPQAAVPVPEVEKRTLQLHPTEIVTVRPVDVDERLKVTGSVFPSQEAAVAAQVSGLAETVLVQPGDTVEAGDLLVDVGTSDLQLQLEQQRATVASTMVQLEAAKTALAQTETLVERSLAPKNTLDAAKAEVDRLAATVATQQTQVTLAEANLERAHVRAPFSGTISSRIIEPGQVVSPGTTMLSLVDLSSLRVEVMVRLADVARVEVGQEVELRVQGFADTVFVGKVDRINPIAETGTRSIKVFLTIDNAEGKLRGGMFVSGDIVVREKADVLAVPATAVQSRGDQHFVIAIEDGVLEERPVELGSVWAGGTMFETQSGLSQGDIIVSSEMSGLTLGSPVSIEAN
jgi:membrane fusion protein (multidrug efflux system)